MSDTPTTRALLNDILRKDPEALVQIGILQHMNTMERFLRYLRGNANCYVSADKLREIDTYLQSTETPLKNENQK